MRPWQVGAERAPGTNDARYSASNELDTPMLWLLAALSFGAGVIHLSMVPSHVEESIQLGGAFAAAGWFQIASGIAMLVRPTRRWLLAAVGADVVFIGVWALSRTRGLPAWMGGHGHEAIAAADATTVAFESAFVLGALAIIATRLLASARRSGFTVAAVIPVGVLVATTTVLALPSTANHSHHHHRDLEVASAHQHVHSTIGHSHAAPTSTGGHVHQESDITYADLPPTTKVQIDQVIWLYARRYPTAAVAKADGWYQTTKSLYGIGAHYLRVESVDRFDPLRPDNLIFDGDGPDAKLAGVMYFLGYKPEGFAGPYDVWHEHDAACVANGITVSLIEESSPIWLSESECRARGGRVQGTAGNWMLHVWIGPDYIDYAPIFAHDHPMLYDGYVPKRDFRASLA